MVKKYISTFLIFSILSLYSSPILAQGDPAFATPEGNDEVPKVELPKDASWAECHMLGKSHGKNVGTGGAMAGGLAGGLLLGLIGTGIAVLAQSESDPPGRNIFDISEKESECQYAYIEAFNTQSVSEKRKAALTGGLIGTVVLVAIVVAASGE